MSSIQDKPGWPSGSSSTPGFCTPTIFHDDPYELPSLDDRLFSDSDGAEVWKFKTSPDNADKEQSSGEWQREKVESVRSASAGRRR